MPATPLDSAIYRDLLHDGEVAALFSDAAQVRAMLLVEGALAKVQGALGVIPAEAGAAIERASREVVIDPASLAEGAGQSAVPVPALVAAFRAQLDPGHGQYLHWGATSQDILDTALVLRLRRVLELYEARLTACLTALADLAETHAELPMAGRTYGQIATPTSFGAVAASWGGPLLGQHAKLVLVRGDLLHVSLSGAAGTLAAMGEAGPQVRAGLAGALGLKDPGGSWHATRDTVAGLGGWLTATAAALGKMGEDLLLLTQSGIGEVALGSTGGSSTMPQKANPVGPSVLVALARHTVAVNTGLQGAALHRQERDGAAWMAEWLALPQMCLAAGRALALGAEIAASLTPRPGRMAANLAADGMPAATEALSFALAATLPRAEAQTAAAALSREAAETGTPLPDLAARAHPGPDWAALLTPTNLLGQAPTEARAFADAARALSSS